MGKRAESESESESESCRSVARVLFLSLARRLQKGALVSQDSDECSMNPRMYLKADGLATDLCLPINF